MGRKFYGDVGILVEQFHEFVERCHRLRTQCRLIEIVEDVVNKHWCHDRCKRELQHSVFRLCRSLHPELLLVVEIAFASAKQHIVNVGFYLLGERAIALYVQFEVSSIVTHHIDDGCRKLVAILLIHPTSHCLYNLRIVEAEDVVITACISTV